MLVRLVRCASCATTCCAFRSALYGSVTSRSRRQALNAASAAPLRPCKTQPQMPVPAVTLSRLRSDSAAAAAASSSSVSHFVQRRCSSWRPALRWPAGLRPAGLLPAPSSPSTAFAALLQPSSCSCSGTYALPAAPQPSCGPCCKVQGPSAGDVSMRCRCMDRSSLVRRVSWPMAASTPHPVAGSSTFYAQLYLYHVLRTYTLV